LGEIVVTDAQVKFLMREYNKSGKLEMSSIKAGMTRKTGRKYLDRGVFPGEVAQVHNWRTRKDPFDEVTEEIESLLELSPGLEAKTIFGYLQEQYPDKFSEGQLRTLQRKVKNWRIKSGKEKEIFFPQNIPPGKYLQADWVDLNKLNITIRGAPYSHKICHFVLPYSNWEWGSICRSESLLSLQNGLQETLYYSGKAPGFLQTDNSSAATHRVKKDESERDFNEDYKKLLRYYNMKPQKININAPNENGDVESKNGHLKRQIKQQLMLRGSKDFESVEEYEKFLHSVFEKSNKNKKEKLKEELKYMHEIPQKPYPSYQALNCFVGKGSTIRVKKVTYSVPSRLIGETLRAHAYETHIDLFYKNEKLITLIRKLGDRGSSVDYRHLIYSLLRKPGAFACYKYKEEMFPTINFRKFYDRLIKNSNERKAAILYLQTLKLATEVTECEVDSALEQLLEGDGEKLTLDALKELLNLSAHTQEDLSQPEPDLGAYDSLFLSEREYKNVSNN